MTGKQLTPQALRDLDALAEKTILAPHANVPKVSIGQKPISEMTVEEMRKERAAIHFTVERYGNRMTLVDRQDAARYFNALAAEIARRQ